MNKRKIDSNELKQLACKGKKTRTINVKYETVFAYFKQKESKDLPMFRITFLPVINDLLAQLAAVELVDKLEKGSHEPIKPLAISGGALKLDAFEMKALSKQNRIQEICGCLYVEGHDKRFLGIQRGKLINFFKHLRTIYADFCYCAGEKVIVEAGELRLLYEYFLTHWNKNQQKGRLNAVEKLQMKICRSLYFLGILIENNILEAIEETERRKKEQESDLGTKSEHKKNIKGVNQQVSTVHSFGSLDPSTLSTRLKSETSQEEIFPIRNNLTQYSQYSQKSQKVVSRPRVSLWDKVEVRNLRFSLSNEVQEGGQLQIPKYEINYLSNDVENILIEQAFKMQKFTDSCYRNENTATPYQYCMVDYTIAPHNQYQNQYQVGNYYVNGYMPYPYPSYQTNHYPQQYLPSYEYHSGDQELTQLKRSLGCLNLVHTRKKDKDRYQ